MSRLFKRLLSRYQDTRILDNLRHRTVQGEHQGETDVDSHEGESTPDGEGPSGGHGGESSPDVETMHAEGGDTQRITNETRE